MLIRQMILVFALLSGGGTPAGASPAAPVASQPATSRPSTLPGGAPQQERVELPTYGFAAGRPAGWSAAKGLVKPENALTWILLGGRVADRGDEILSSISVQVEKLPPVSARQVADAVVRKKGGSVAGETRLGGEIAVRVSPAPKKGFGPLEQVIAVRNGHAYYVTLEVAPDTMQPAAWQEFLRTFEWVEIRRPAEVLHLPAEGYPLVEGVVRIDLPPTVRRIPHEKNPAINDFLIYNLKDSRAEFSVHVRPVRAALPMVGERQKLVRYVAGQMKLHDTSAIQFRPAEAPGAPAGSMWTPFIDSGEEFGGRERWGFIPITDEVYVIVSLHILGNTALGDVRAYEKAANRIAGSLRLDPGALNRATSRPSTQPSPKVRE